MTFDKEIRHWPTLDAFVAHLQTVLRPAWCQGVTNHNTYKPDESAWLGMASMRALATFYEHTQHWSAGPHLFLAADAPNPADRGIFQLTPISHIGIHAGPCNDSHLGIENVGDFQARPPSAAQYQLLIDVNRAILQAWMLTPDKVNVHNECMVGRTCPGKYLPGAKIRADLARPPSDTWRLWGTAFPLPVEQRAWAIPRLWFQNASWLGDARSDEVYIDPQTSIRSFRSGWITYEKLSDTARVFARVRDLK